MTKLKHKNQSTPRSLEIREHIVEGRKRAKEQRERENREHQEGFYRKHPELKKELAVA